MEAAGRSLLAVVEAESFVQEILRVTQFPAATEDRLQPAHRIPPALDCTPLPVLPNIRFPGLEGTRSPDCTRRPVPEDSHSLGAEVPDRRRTLVHEDNSTLAKTVTR
jgi:hypothetical protein